MEKEHIEELIDSVKLAQDGYWMPLSIIAALFAIIIILLISFWKKSESYHHSKHKENDEFKKEYEKQMTNVSILVQRHDVEIEHLKERS